VVRKLARGRRANAHDADKNKGRDDGVGSLERECDQPHQETSGFERAAPARQGWRVDGKTQAGAAIDPASDMFSRYSRYCLQVYPTKQLELSADRTQAGVITSPSAHWL
jgi:hypothetical protein